MQVYRKYRQGALWKRLTGKRIHKPVVIQCNGNSQHSGGVSGHNVSDINVAK